MKQITRGIMIILIVTLLLTGCMPKESTEKTAIKIGHLPASQGLPLYLALEKGYFEEKGITVELITFDSPNLLVQALESGQIDFGAPSTAAGITAVAEAANPGQLKIFAVAGSTTKEEDTINEILIVGINRSIQSIEELKGKKVGILPSIQWRTIAKEIFAKNSISTDNDLTLVELAGGMQLQALASSVLTI